MPLRLYWVWLVVSIVAVVASCATAAGPPEPALLHPLQLVRNADLAIFARCPTHKIMPDENLSTLDDLVEADSLRLYTCRNESEQVSLVLRPSSVLEDVSLEFSGLTGPGSIPDSALSWRRVKCVQVGSGSNWYGLLGTETGPVPDPLLPPDPFTAPADTNTTLLVEINTPLETPAGEYEGQIRLLAGGDVTATVPLKLTVWDIALPHERHFITHGHEMSDDPAVYRQMREDDVTILKYGVREPVHTSLDESGELHVDLSDYHPQAQFLLDELGFGAVAFPPSHLGAGHSMHNYLGTHIKVGSPEFWPVFDQYMHRMADYFRSHGWSDRVYFKPADELQSEHHELMARIMRRSKEIFPEMPIVLTTTELSDDLAGALDVWVVPWHFFATRVQDIERWDRLRERGLTLWSYMNSVFMLNATWNPAAMRYYPPVSAKYGFKGALWWNFNAYRDKDPWERAIATQTRIKDGKRRRNFANGYVFYPPREGEKRFHSSLRWENYQQGLDEYDMLMILKDHWITAARSLGVSGEDPTFSPDAALRRWGQMLSTGFRLQSYRRDSEYIHRFRQLVAHEILYLLDPPLVLVDCGPEGLYVTTPQTNKARAASERHVEGADSITIRGICASGSSIQIDGNTVETNERGGTCVFEYELFPRPGRKVLEITAQGPEGSTKTLYREIFVQAPIAVSR